MVYYKPEKVSFTYTTTVLVDTMYSTSLVQGFFKPYQRLLSVMNEPSFIFQPVAVCIDLLCLQHLQWTWTEGDKHR